MNALFNNKATNAVGFVTLFIIETLITVLITIFVILPMVGVAWIWEKIFGKNPLP